MIKMTKQNFDEYVTPFIKKALSGMKNFDTYDEIIGFDSYKKVLDNVFQYSTLLESIKELTPLQVQLAKRRGFFEELNNLKKFLEES